MPRPGRKLLTQLGDATRRSRVGRQRHQQPGFAGRSLQVGLAHQSGTRGADQQQVDQVQHQRKTQLGTLAAAGLSPLVWRLSGKFSAADSIGVGFFAIHLIAACLFSLVWTFVAPALGMWWDGGSISEMEWGVQVNAWRLFMGVWWYVIVAGISYASRMYTRLNVQREIAARAEALAAEARLAAMRSQLQPHFLFNALHSVSSLIETAPTEAVDAMEMLGDLLRYAIRDRGSHWVEMGEEWQFVGDYVALQQLRFGENVSIHMDIEPGAKSVQVPAFLLQPLVENAFIHGISALPGGGSIWIRAHIESEELIVRVADDGVGMTGSPSNIGTGLDNLKQRLASLYGSNATLDLSKREGGGTIAEIRCPAQ